MQKNFILSSRTISFHLRLKSFSSDSLSKGKFDNKTFLFIPNFEEILFYFYIILLLWIFYVLSWLSGWENLLSFSFFPRLSYISWFFLLLINFLFSFDRQTESKDKLCVWKKILIVFLRSIEFYKIQLEELNIFRSEI